MTPLRQRIAAALSDLPITLQVLGALGSVLVIFVPGLGLLAHRHRLLLLQLPEGALHYAPDQLGITGLTALWRLPWRMLLAAFETTTPIYLVTAALGLVAVWLHYRCASSRAPSRLEAIGLLVVFAWAALGFAQLISFDSLTSEALVGSDLVRSWRLETYGWLTNIVENASNAARREALAGLIGWLLIAGIQSARLAGHVRQTPWRRGLLVGHALILLFVVGLVPRGHAYAHWGMAYPEVIQVDKKCEPDLSRLLSLRCVKAWHVSVPSTNELVLIRRRDGVEHLQPLTHPDGGRCASLGPRSVVGASGFIPDSSGVDPCADASTSSSPSP